MAAGSILSEKSGYMICVFRFLTSVSTGFEMTGLGSVCHPEPVIELVMPRILSRGIPQKCSLLLRLGPFLPSFRFLTSVSTGFEMTRREETVIPNQLSNW